MKLLTVLVLPLCGVLSSVSQDKTYQNSISALISPDLCQLKLICAISKSQNAKLLDSIFMRGIRAISDFSQLTPAGNTTDARLLSQSVTAGVESLVLPKYLILFIQASQVCPAAPWPRGVRTRSENSSGPPRTSVLQIRGLASTRLVSRDSPEETTEDVAGVPTDDRVSLCCRGCLQFSDHEELRSGRFAGLVMFEEMSAVCTVQVSVSMLLASGLFSRIGI